MFVNLKSKIQQGSQRSVTVKKNIIYSFLIKGGSIFLSMLIVPLTLGYVSTELYGIWLTLSSVIAWFHFFDMGLTLEIKNRLTEALTVNDTEKAKRLVSTTYISLCSIFIPLAILLICITPKVDWATVLNVNYNYNTEIIKTVVVFIAFFFSQLILNTITSVISAFQKTALAGFLNMLGQLLALLIINLATLWVAPSLVILCFAFVGSPVIVLFLSSLLFYCGRFKMVSPNIRYFNFSEVKNLFGMGVKFFLIQIQIIILFQSTNILISHISGAEDVAEYNIAYKYLNCAIMFYNILLTPVWPAFTEAYITNDYSWMKRIRSKMYKIYVLTSLIIIGMALVSPLIYHIWLGDKISITILMTSAISVYMIVNAWSSCQVSMINGIGKIKLQMYVTLIGTIFHIPFSLFLSNFIGIYGIFLSMVIITFVYSVMFTIQLEKLLNKKAIGIWDQ